MGAGLTRKFFKEEITVADKSGNFSANRPKVSKETRNSLNWEVEGEREDGQI